MTPGGIAILALLGILSAFRLDLRGGLISAGLLCVSLLFHELGHLVTATACGVRVTAVGLSIKGAFLRRANSHDPGKEAAIAICGPMASLLVFCLFRDSGAVLNWVAQLNLVLAVTNLIPIEGTDGYRFVRGLVELGRFFVSHYVIPRYTS